MSKSISGSLAGLIAAIVICFSSSGTAVAQNGGAPNYAGYLDHAGCDVIGGWAADRNTLGNSITVKIYSDGMFVATLSANLSRPDVGSYLGDNGLHGFNLATPPFLKDGQTHQITAYFDSSTVALANGSASLFCAPASPPPLCADHVITTTPNQGSSTMVVNHLCRDANLRTRYDAGRFVTIDDPVAQRTIVEDTVAQTYSMIPWHPGLPIQNGGTAQTAYLTAQGGANPPARPNTACNAPGTTYTVKGIPPPSPAPISSSAASQTLNVWTCASLVLPMYVEVIDPSFGTHDLEIKNISLVPPDPQIFTVPPTYTRDDSFSMSSGFSPVSGTGCAVQQTVDPLILVTSSAHRGQTIVTSLAGGFGCTFSDATIYTGPALAAAPLTSIGGQVFQFSLSDGGNPSYSSQVDTAQVSLFTNDGAVATRSLIFVKIN